MSIYTRTGDRGKTSLYGGKRVSKSYLQIDAYGSVDELTSYLGLVQAKVKSQKSKVYLIEIQKDLYKIMAHLAGAKVDLRFLDSRVKKFEKKIDEIEKKLPKLSRFILPGGTELSAWFHVLRVVCRRTERNVVRFFEQSTISNQQLTILKYLNRLSDLFFILARWQNKVKDLMT